MSKRPAPIEEIIREQEDDTLIDLGRYSLLDGRVSYPQRAQDWNQLDDDAEFSVRLHKPSGAVVFLPQT